MTDSLRYVLLRSLRFCLNRPRLVVYATLALVLAGTLLSARLQFLLSIDDLIDPDFTTYQNLKEVNESFHDKNTIFLSIESDSIFTKPFLCDLQTWILDTAHDRQDLIEIRSSFGVPKVTVGKNLLRVPSSLDIDCSKRDVPETEKIEAGLNWVRGSPWQDVLSLKKRNGLTVNFLVLDPKDKKYGSIDTQVVGQLEASYGETLGKSYPQFQTFWGGVTTYQSHLREAFDQTLALNGLMFLISFVIFRVFLGSWTMGFIFNGSVLMTLMITYGIMAILGTPIDVLTNSIGLMTIVATLEDLVFVAFGVQRFGWSIRKSLRRFLMPAFLTSLTTWIGFESLAFSDLGIIRRFGSIAGMAAMIEFAILFLVLPAAIKLWPRAKVFRATSKPPLIRLHKLVMNRGNRWVAAVLVAAAFIPLAFSNRLRVEDSPADFFRAGHPASTILEHLQVTRGWINESSLLFARDTQPEQQSRIVKAVGALPEVHLVESNESVEGFLAAGLNEPDGKLLKNLWRSSPNSERLVSQDGNQRAQVFLNTMNMEQIRTVIDKIKNICPNGECSLVGSLISYNEFSVRVLKTLFDSLGSSLLLVIGILFVVGRHLRWRELGSCMIAAVWGPCALMSVFIVFDVPLFFVTCVCASVLVGLAGDSPIQFIYQSRQQKGKELADGVDELAEGSLIIMAGMMMLTTVFFLSAMAPLAKLGGMMILGFFLGYAGDVFVLKGLLGEKRSK